MYFDFKFFFNFSFIFLIEFLIVFIYEQNLLKFILFVELEELI